MKEPLPNPNVYLFAPGPHAGEKSYLDVLSQAILGHRDPVFVETLKNLGAGLTELLEIEGYAKPFITTGHATDQFSNVAQLVRQETDDTGAHRYVGNIVLVNSDVFSKKAMTELRKAGVKVNAIDVAPGKVVDLEQLATAVATYKPDVVFVTSSCTTSGSYQLVQGERLRQAIGIEPLLVVDEVSLMAGAHIPREELGIDFGFAGSQKAWMLPPGIVVAYATPRALERAKGARVAGIHNLAEIAEKFEEGKPSATDNTSLIRALERRVYDMIQAGGAAALNDRNVQLNVYYTDFLGRLAEYGITSFPNREEASPTVGCFTYQLARTDMKRVAEDMKTDESLVHGYKGVKIDTGYKDVNEYVKSQGLGTVRIPIFGQDPEIFMRILDRMETLIKRYTV